MLAAEEVAAGGSTFSNIASGWGIQALAGFERTDENYAAFYEDIMRVGLGQCEPKLVRILVEESGPRFDDSRSYGLRFQRENRGDYLRARGCFSEVQRAFLTKDICNVRQSFLSIIRRLPVRIVTENATDRKSEP